jgi:hypothetical protein
MNPLTVAGPPGGWGPPPPRRSSSVAVGCAIVAGVIVVLIAGTCVALRFFAPTIVRRAQQAGQQEITRLVEPVQAQAAALGRVPPDATAACALNSPRLATAMPCPAYVGWITEHAPYFPGATVTLSNVQEQMVQGGWRATITVRAVGPNGEGTLAFGLVRTGTERWTIDAVSRTETTTP